MGNYVNIFLNRKKNNSMKMQIQTPPQLAAEIAKLSARMIAAGVKRQAARPGKIYRRLVEYGVERWHTELSDEQPKRHELINQLSGGKGNQVEFDIDTRLAINAIARHFNLKDVEAANACAWWGLEAFTQYVHALEASYTPKEKRSVGRPRKHVSHE